MTVTLQLTPEQEHRLRARAARHGQDVATYLLAVAERETEPEPPIATAARVSLMSLPLDERRRLMAQGAAALEADYRADLARPVEERELTAITALDNDPLIEEYPHHAGG